MNVDIAALRRWRRKRASSSASLIETLETALLTAYRHTQGHAGHARVEIDRKTGEIRVLGQEPRHQRAEGDVVREWDDTPEDFGRIAATTARQVILQRLRDVDNERTFGDFAGREHDLITGTVSADAKVTPAAWSSSASATSRASSRPPSRSPGETYTHGQRLRCYVVSVAGARADRRSPCPGPTRTWCASCSRSRSRRSPTARWRSPPSPGRPATGRRSRCGRRSPGSTPRAPASVRWAPGARRDERAQRREDRHHRSRRRSGHVRRQRAVAGQGPVGRRSSTRWPGPPAWSSPISSSRWLSARRGRTPGWPPGSPAGGSTSAATPRRTPPRPPDRPDPPDARTGGMIGKRADPTRRR